MTFASPSWLLLALPIGLLWLLLWRSLGGLRWLLFSWLCVLALGDPQIPAGRDSGGNVVLLVDRSASVRGEALTRALALAPTLERYAQARRAALYVVGFGRGAALLAAPGESLEASRSASVQDDSDLQAGLQLAAAQPDVSDIVLISDGVYTSDDPSPLAVQLKQQGVRIHTLQVGTRNPADASITRILTPQRVPRGQPFTVAIEVDAQQAQNARLSLRDKQGQLLVAQTLALDAGVHRYALRLDASQLGVHELSAELEAEADKNPGNNRARSVVEVLGPPRVLVYTHNPDSALVRALGSAGLQLDLRSHGEALQLSELSGAAAVVLENMSLQTLGDAADAALDDYVRKLGGGLLITGGEDSYALGGYYRSKLEQLLPVTMDRKDELRRPRLDMAIALDRSGSMAAPVGGGLQKMDLANRGASEAIELLANGDGVTVMAVDTAAHVIVPLQRLSDAQQKRRLLAKVRSIESSGGGIYVHTALAAAMDALLAASSQTRHVVLFADAADAEEPGDYQALVTSFRQAGGTLSVIGLGTEQDPDARLLREIAELGGGRVYFTADAMQLPRVFAQDVMYVARKTFVREATPVEPARGLLALQLLAENVPAVGGYNACYLAQHAEASLMTGDSAHAPLAASWQRGAGKVMAITFEADGPYTGAIGTWPEYKAFFRAALEWIKRPSGEPELDAELDLEGHNAVVRVELPPGHQLSSAPEAWLFADDGRAAQPLRLAWVGPNTLTARAPADSNHAYQAAIALPGQPALELPWSVLPYSPEFAALGGTSRGDEVLSRLAETTQGGVYTQSSDLDHPRLRPNRPARSLADLIALLALCLMLLDIAVRRGLWSGWFAGAAERALQLTAAVTKRVARRPRPAPTEPDATLPAAAELARPPEPADNAQPTAAAPNPPPPAAADGQLHDALSEAKRRARQRRGK